MLNQSQIDEARKFLEIADKEGTTSCTIVVLKYYFSAIVDLRNGIHETLPLLTDAAKTSLAVRTARNHLKHLLR